MSILSAREHRLRKYHASRRAFLASLGWGGMLLSSQKAAARLFFGGASTASSFSGTVFDVKGTYGAKLDTVQVTDGATTSGSVTFTTSQYSFSAPDIGKTVSVESGTGTAGAYLTRTIASINSPTSVQLSGSTTGIGTITGALAYIGTDDTTAWNNAVSAVASAGAGVIVAPAGVSMIAGPLLNASTQNAQIPLPFVDQSTSPPTKQKVIAIVGAAMSSPAYYVNGTTQAPTTSGTILVSLIPGTGTAPSVISAGTQNGSFPGNFSGINVQVDNITIRTAHYGQAAICGLNCHAAYCMTAQGVIVDTAATDNTKIANAPPVTGLGAAFRTPNEGNGAFTHLIDCVVSGKNTGFDMWEHTTLSDVECYFTQQAYNLNGTTHPMYATRFAAQHCTVAVNGAGVCAFNAGQLDIETATSGWTQGSFDISDAANNINGSTSYEVVIPFTGVTAIRKNGGANFTTTRLR